MADARRARLIDWERIQDRTRDLETFSCWDNPADVVRGAAQQHREDLWLDQECRPEVWIEKAALIGVIWPACERWRVPHMAARGYPSHSELYAAGKRLQGHLEDGQEPIVFYLGDHDPSGLDTTRSLREELSLYARHPIEVVRLGLIDALSPSFIDELVENAIRKLVEEEAWSKALERERVNKDLLYRMARSFASPVGAPP